MSRFASLDDCFRWTESFLSVDRGGYRPRPHRLARMRTLFAAFGDPHRGVPIIHVTGSKGKGSTAAFIGEILAAAGRVVGVYASPHVASYRERVRIMGAPFADETAIGIFDSIAGLVGHDPTQMTGETAPTPFELLTLFGFLAFRSADCDAAVVEVGLGGRIDATNLVDPIASVITPVELEHTEQLGPTLRSVAAEKSAIIKRGRPVFFASQQQEAERVIRRVAELRRAPCAGVPEAVHEVGYASLPSPRISISLRSGLSFDASLSMAGRVQAANAALATLVVSRLYPDIPAAAFVEGLSRTRLPGRSELFPGSPPVLLDGAHTVDSIRNLCETASEICRDPRRRVTVFGAVAGKRHADMLAILTECFARVFVTTPGTFKASDPHRLYRLCLLAAGSCSLVLEPDRAFEAAIRTSPGLLVVCGSFYLVGEVRSRISSRVRAGEA